MNMLQIIVDVIMALIIAFLVFLGVKRGFAKSFFKSTKIVFVILVTILIGSLIVSLCQNLFVNAMFEGKISDKLVSYTEQSEGEFDFEKVKEGIPAIIRNIVPMDEIEQQFSTLSGDEISKAREIGTQIEKIVINIVSNVTGYVIAFILSFIICSIAIAIIERVFELPVINWLNRLGGVFWGVANAYLTTSFIVCVIALIFGNDFVNGTIVTKAIYYIGLFTF